MGGGGWGVCFFFKKYVFLLKSLKKERPLKFVEIFWINAPILLPIAPWAPGSQAPIAPLKEEHEDGFLHYAENKPPCWLLSRDNMSAMNRGGVGYPVLAVLKQFNSNTIAIQ